MLFPRTGFSDDLMVRSRSRPGPANDATRLASSEPAPPPSGKPAPDPDGLRRVQLRRKAVLAVVIFGFIGAAAVTRPLSGGSIWQGLLTTAGVTAIFGAILGRAWCSLYIGGRKTREIVRRGPYSVCRNPLYVFSLLAAFGVGAQTGSLVLTTGVLILTFLVLYRTVLREEAWLRVAFGADYERYLGDTPRFWPRWSAWADEPRLEISPARFVTTVLDGSVLVLALPVMAALAAARAEGLVPALLTLP